MKKGLLVGTTVLASLAVAILPAGAGSAPTPVYSATCAVGGYTGANWQRAKLVQVTLEWAAPAGSGVTFQPVTAPTLSPTPPHGYIFTPTPSSAGVNPVSATALFLRTDGTTDQVTVPCT